MSIYSGKCDVYDTLVSIHQYTEEELIKNVKIYVGNSDEPLEIESYKSLIPYYPYIVASAYFNNKDRQAIISLSSESFVDEEERERLEWYLKDILKIYNRCKRNKEEFDVEMAVDGVSWFSDKDVIREIARRVKESGARATLDGIHLEFHEHYYRQLLVDKMIENGLNPFDYGYGRFVEGDI